MMLVAASRVGRVVAACCCTCWCFQGADPPLLGGALCDVQYTKSALGGLSPPDWSRVPFRMSAREPGS
jgi:hypothetical protein